MMKLLTRRECRLKEDDSTYTEDNDGHSDDACVVEPLHAAACTGRIFFDARAGLKW